MFNRRKNPQFLFVFFFAVFLALCIQPLIPQEYPEYGKDIITSIEVTGLKRTKPHIAQYPLEQFLGREGSSLDLNEVQAVIRNMGTLEPLAIELAEAEDGLILRVTVEERWSIFPFPVISAGSGGSSFGLFLADTNAFGLRDRIAIGGMYGSSGWMLMGMYQHTPNRRGQPGWQGFFSYNRREKEDVDKNETVHRRYTSDQLRISMGLNYPFTGYVSGSFGFTFTNISLKENENPVNQPENGAMLLGFTPGISVRNSNWDGFFLSQQSLSLSYTWNLALAGSSYHQADFRGVYEQSFVPGFRLIVRSGAVWKSEADLFFEEGPQRAQVDILPRKFSARHYAGFSFGLEKYIFRIRAGTFSVLASWQCVISNGPVSGLEFDQGPSGGVRFYLSRLALPALGAGVAYNINTGLFQFAFNLGMEF